MVLPEKLGKISHERLHAIIDQLTVGYTDYITPNVEYIIDNMKRKLELLNPSSNIQQNSEKFVNNLKDYMKNFFNESIKFSEFKKNDRELNEQFNIVLEKIIDNLKNGNKVETVSLVKLLRKLIEEMMKRHSIKEDNMDKNLFVDRLKNLAMKPIQIVRGNNENKEIGNGTSKENASSLITPDY